MSFDAVALRACIGEVRNLRGARVQKIYETPDEDAILLHLYGGGRRPILLISTDRQHARLHLTRRKYSHPRKPSNFCMVLRKHLTAGALDEVSQVDMDRLARLTISSYDDLGRTRQFTLVAETMGRFSNALLLDEEERILTARRFISADRNAHRTILPGHPYRRPPVQDALPLEEVSAHALKTRLISDGGSDAPPAWLWLVRNVQGPGPVEARRLLRGIGLQPKDPMPADAADLARLAEELQRCARVVRTQDWRPYLVTRWSDSPGLPEPVAVGVLPPPPTPADRRTRVRDLSTPSGCLDAYYALREEWDAYTELRKNLLKSLRDACERIERRIEKQEREMERSEDAEAARRRGEILTTYMFQVPERAEQVTLSNYYEDGEPITIELDPKRSPADNAAAYFDRYRKLQRTQRIGRRKVDGSRRELDYAQTLLDSAQRAETRTELEEIRGEARRAGYVKRPQRRSGSKRDGAKARPYRKYVTSSGAVIYVGRHNRGNDYLITRLANPDDLWLHVKDMPGSHVLVPGPWSGDRQLDDRVLREAAALAAYHSSARHSSNVPVDYTLVKHVKKPKGSKPGMVTYTDQQTLFVTPPRKLEQYRQRAD